MKQDVMTKPYQPYQAALPKPTTTTATLFYTDDEYLRRNRIREKIARYGIVIKREAKTSSAGSTDLSIVDIVILFTSHITRGEISAVEAAAKRAGKPFVGLSHNTSGQDWRSLEPFRSDGGSRADVVRLVTSPELVSEPEPASGARPSIAAAEQRRSESEDAELAAIFAREAEGLRETISRLIAEGEGLRERFDQAVKRAAEADEVAQYARDQVTSSEKRADAAERKHAVLEAQNLDLRKGLKAARDEFAAEKNAWEQKEERRALAQSKAAQVRKAPARPRVSTPTSGPRAVAPLMNPDEPVRCPDPRPFVGPNVVEEIARCEWARREGLMTGEEAFDRIRKAAR